MHIFLSLKIHTWKDIHIHVENSIELILTERRTVAVGGAAATRLVLGGAVISPEARDKFAINLSTLA